MSTFVSFADLGITDYELPQTTDYTKTRKTRHPLSAPAGTVRNEWMQCEYCQKTKGPDVKLFQCTGCRTDMYCSKQCQKLAWPEHKELCKAKQRLHRDLCPVHMDALQALRDFDTKHRPTLGDVGIQALDAVRHPENMTRRFLVIELRRRPATRVEQAFYAIGAAVVTYENMERCHPAWASALKAQQQKWDAYHKSIRDLGAFMIVMSSLDCSISSVLAVGVDSHTPDGNQPPWRLQLARNLNEGILV